MTERLRRLRASFLATSAIDLDQQCDRRSVSASLNWSFGLLSIGEDGVKKRESLTAWFRKSGLRFVVRHSFTERHFNNHTKAIGQLLLAWNDLHERLATLFARAMGIDKVDRSLTIWHGIRSDYSKRQLLRAAIGTLEESEIASRDKLVVEIEWILNQADKLEGYRDDSAHTPLHFTTDLFRVRDIFAVDNIFQPDGEVLPNIGFLNPRAERVDQTKKDLLIEYRYARERINTLRDYTAALEYAWSNSPQLGWPHRPDLPERKPKQARRNALERETK